MASKEKEKLSPIERYDLEAIGRWAENSRAIFNGK